MLWREEVKAEGRKERRNAILDSVIWSHPQSRAIWKQLAIKDSGGRATQAEGREHTKARKEAGGAGVRREGCQPGRVRSGSHGHTGLFLCPSLRCTAASPHPTVPRWTSSVPTASLQPKDHPALKLWTHTHRQVVLLARFYHDIQIQGPLPCHSLNLLCTS